MSVLARVKRLQRGSGLNRYALRSDQIGVINFDEDKIMPRQTKNCSNISTREQEEILAAIKEEGLSYK